jgi:hypothetical protein
MSMTTPRRWSGIASMIGSPVFPFALLLHPTRAIGTSSTLVHVLVSAALVLLLLGLPGFYLGQKTWMKNLGLIGVLIAGIGTLLQVGYVLVDGFLAPAAAPSASSSVLGTADVHLLFLSSVGPLALLVLLIEFWFVVGSLLFAVETVQAHVFPRWAGLLLSGAVLFGTQILLPSFVTDLGAALLGLAFPEMGYVLMFQAGNEVEP